MGGCPHFPFRRTDPLHPPAELGEARATAPVLPVTLWNGRRAWVVTRQKEIRKVLSDDERFSGRFGQEAFPTVTEARVAVDRGERAFVGMDNPEHDRFRRMFTREFSVRRMMALEPDIRAIAHRLLDELERAGPPQDLVPMLAVRFPSLVMSLLFGSPYEDHRFIIECAVARHGLTQSPGEAERKARELAHYCHRLIEARMVEPRDDMVSRVIADQVRPGLLSVDDFAEIGAMILRGGHDTTVNMIGMGTLLLLQNEQLRDQLRAAPELIPAAIEELLRFVSPVQYAPRRVALEDVEMGGVLIRKGDGIFPLLQAANRDECVFPNPDELDITRDNASQLAFGFGIHQCLGQMLARVELQIMFAAILERLPNLRLAAPVEEIRFKSDMQIYGIYNLPVTW